MKRSGPIQRRTPMPRPTAPLKPRGEGKAKREARYAAFIRSPEWKAIRRKALAAAGRQCQAWRTEDGVTWRCRETSHLEVHHQTYARFGGQELLEDLLVLCRPCHRRHHALGSQSGLTHIGAIVPAVMGELLESE